MAKQTKEEIEKERKAIAKVLVKAGLQLTGDEDLDELKAKKAELDEKTSGTSEVEKNNKDSKIEKNTVYVFVKIPNYISDDKRVGAGLYEMKASEIPERLKKASKEHCEIFEGSISGIELAHIAKQLGVDDSRYRGENGDKELLKVLLTAEFKPF